MRVDFLTGALVALLAATVIPFATEQWSLWSKRRGQIIAARREALDHYEQTTARVKMNYLAEYPGGGVRYEVDVANDADLQAAAARFVAQFSLRDKPIHDLWNQDRPHAGYRLILASWANGENRRARRAARKLIEERHQRELRQPERRAPDQTSEQTE